MKKYQKYIAGLCFSSFIKTLIFLSVIIVCIKTLTLTQQINREATVDFKTLGWIIFSVFPHVIVNLAPFALAIGCYIAISSLLSSSQITILQNAGVHKIKLSLTPLYIIIPVAVLMIILESTMLTYATAMRKKIQHNIVAEQTRYFLIPSKTKTFGNITIITSPLNDSGKIPMTFIHKQSPQGFMVLVGNIEESWSMENFLGIKAKDATIVTTSSEGENTMQFKTLETQLNLLVENEQISSYSAFTTSNLIKEYQNTQNPEIKKQIIKIINERITPSFLAILLPFALVTLQIRFHNGRKGVSIFNIIKIVLLVGYCTFCCYSLNRIFTSIDNFYYIYANIFLTFLFICFLNFRLRFFKKNV